MKQLFVSSFVTFSMFSKVCFLRLICILLVSFVVHLFWRVNEDESENFCVKIAGVLLHFR